MRCGALVAFSLVFIGLIGLLVNFISNYLAIKGQIHIYATNLRCFNVNEEVVLLEKCQLQKKRGQKGTIDGFGKFKQPLNDIWIEIRFFRRDSNGVFQKHIVNMKFDVCNAHHFLSDFNPLKKAIQKFSDRILQPPVMDQIAQGCPIAGPVNVTNFEFERDLKEYTSPFFHKGTFMIYVRFRTKNNATYIEIETTLEIRAAEFKEYISDYIRPI